jgi:glycosyltransferase involved in cell wall biosynthesis
MRILQVSSLWPPVVLGGAELYAGALAAAQREAGHEVGVVTLGVDGPDVVAQVPAWPYRLEVFAGQPGWKRALSHARDQYDPVAARRVGEAIRDFGADVVHSHSVPGLSVTALTAAGRAGVAHVHTLHDYWLLCQRTTMVGRDGQACATRCGGCRVVSGLRDRLLARRPPEVVIAVSEAVGREHLGLAAMAGRIRVVPNPVDVAPTVPAAARRSGPPAIGYLGQLVDIKGVRTLLRAFAALPPGSAELVVAGSGPLAGEVATAGPGVSALGWVDAAAREAFFGRIDVLVVPSEWKDPAPLVVNEARARGVPVIGADIGGIPELVAPEHRPLLFPSGDAGELARRLRSFLAEPAAFASAPPPADRGWPEHLAAVDAAYADARRLRGTAP